MIESLKIPSGEKWRGTSSVVSKGFPSRTRIKIIFSIVASRIRIKVFQYNSMILTQSQSYFAGVKRQMKSHPNRIINTMKRSAVIHRFLEILYHRKPKGITICLTKIVWKYGNMEAMSVRYTCFACSSCLIDIYSCSFFLVF